MGEFNIKYGIWVQEMMIDLIDKHFVTAIQGRLRFIYYFILNSPKRCYSFSISVNLCSKVFNASSIKVCLLHKSNKLQNSIIKVQQLKTIGLKY